ncbi:MAG: hypothetical protein WD851_12745 [Pirellulales bacterium]
MDGQRTPRALVIGNAEHTDFTDARAELRCTARVWFVPDGDYAQAWLEANRSVDWIVLVQSRPGELPRDIVDRLRPYAGEARFVSLLGSWCEGELRTGQPWPDVARRYWYAFPSWWRSSGIGSSANSLAAARGTRPGIVVVSTVDLESAAALIDALAIEGFSVTWWPRHHAMLQMKGVQAAIWVGGQLSGTEALGLDAFCQRMRSERAPVVALLDFPRRDRFEIAKRIGVAEVLGKPWLTAELSHTLLRLMRDSREAKDIHIPGLRSA